MCKKNSFKGMVSNGIVSKEMVSKEMVSKVNVVKGKWCLRDGGRGNDVQPNGFQENGV